MFEKFVKQNDQGESVLQYDLLNLQERLGLMKQIKDWADTIDIQFTDLEVSNTDKLRVIKSTVDSLGDELLYSITSEPTIQDFTARIILDHMIAHVANRYNVIYSPIV